MRASICATDKYGEHADFDDDDDDEWTDAEEEEDIRLTSMIMVMINGRNGLLKNDDDDGDDDEQGTWTYHCMAPHNVKFPYLSMDDKSGEN